MWERLFGLLENTAVFRFFGNWPVAYRVSAIAATGALGLCAVGVLYAIGSQWQRGHEQAAVAGTEQLARVTSVVIRTQELRLTHLRATTGAIPEATIADLARGLHLDLNQLDPALAATATPLRTYGEDMLAGRALRPDVEARVAAALAALATDAHARVSHTLAAAEASGRLLDQAILGGIGLVAFACLASGLMTGFAISRPIARISKATSTIAGGALETEIPATAQRDEIGRMARALVVFREAARQRLVMEREMEETRLRQEEEKRRLETEAIERERQLVATSIGSALAKLAQKDLSVRITERLPVAYAAVQEDFNNAVMFLEQALAQVSSCTDAIVHGTGQIASSAEDLAERAQRQAASIEETAASLKDVTEAGRKAVEGSRHAREAVNLARADAEAAGQVVHKTTDAMGAIERSASQITRIIGVIDEIAFQTNLLALNAGVEAARAGEAGRGFAVVAAEVRALAQRSASAAREIKELIGTSSKQVAEGVVLAADTGKALERILGKVGDMNRIVLEIAGGAQEQAVGLDAINDAVGQMDRVTQQNAQMAETSTSATRTLSRETQALRELVHSFRLSGAGSAQRAA